MSENNYEEIQNFFKENKYVVVRNFLTPEMCHVFYNYCKTLVKRDDYHSTYYPDSYYNNSWNGDWIDDTQVPGSYGCFGDPLMDSILELGKNAVENYTGLQLLSQYTYWRLYQKHDILERHVDRSSCEISGTLCLGYDVSDVDQTMYPEYDWPMFVKDKDGNELPIHMKPGDIIFYRGCEVEHWRDAFPGKNHAQVFLHYNDANGPHKQLYDGRPFLGLPKFMR